MTTAYQVKLREFPARPVLSLTRHVTNEELTGVGREFIGGFRAAGVRALPGPEGAPFTIYYGEVSEDSDGPIEWCWPVPGGAMNELAGRFPELTLRTDSAHFEAFVHYGRATQLHTSRIALAVQSLLSWAREADRHTAGGLRLLYRAGRAGDGPDLDLALPVR